MFHITIVISITGDEFKPAASLLSSSHLDRAWSPGDFALPGRRGRKFDDSGLAFRILHKYDQTDWLETAAGAFREVGALIWQNAQVSTLPMPLVSIQVATDGLDYPPLYLDRQFMIEVERMKAELDIDIISPACRHFGEKSLRRGTLSLVPTYSTDPLGFAREALI